MITKIDELSANGTLKQWTDTATQGFTTFWNIGSVVFDGLMSAGKFIIDNWGAIGPILAGVLAGFLAFQTTTAVISAVKFAMMGLNLVMAANPISLVVLAIAALVTAGVLLYQHWDVVKAKAQELWTSIITAFSSLGEFFSSLWNGIKTTTENAWNGIKTFFSSTWTSIKDTIVNLVMGMVYAVNGKFQDQIELIRDVLGRTKQVFADIWEAIRIVVLGPVVLLIDLVTGNFTKLKEDAVIIFQNLHDLIGNIFENLSYIILNIGLAIYGTVKKIWGDIKVASETAWNEIKTGISNIWTSIKASVITTAQDLKDGLVAKMEETWAYIKSIPSQAVQWGRDIIQSIINGLKSMHIPTPHFSVFWKWVQVGDVGFSMPNGFDVDWYAKGGAFDKPSIIGVGEGGETEVVSPVSLLKSVMQEVIQNTSQASLATAGGGLTIIVKEMNVRDDNDIKKISKELWSLAESSQRSSGRRG